MRRLAAIVGLIWCVLPASAEEPGAGLPEPVSPLVGTWLTEEMTEITIAPCIDGLCGYLSRIVIPEEIYQANKETIDAIGIENLADNNNPDPALKGRPLLGMPMIKLHTEITPVRYEGELYNPEDGQIYYGKMELADWQTLKLRGCLGWLTFACDTKDRIWTRVPPEDVLAAMENRDELPDNVALWNGLPETDDKPKL